MCYGNHPFKDDVHYNINDIMMDLAKVLSGGKSDLGVKNTKVLSFIWREYFSKNLELKCSICGAKAEYFRKQSEGVFHLICHKTIAGKDTEVIFNRDHILPQSKGGKAADNLQLTCEYCNSQKADKVPDITINISEKVIYGMLSRMDIVPANTAEKYVHSILKKNKKVYMELISKFLVEKLTKGELK